MIEVPQQFRPHIRVEYPENNRQIFEEWFYNHYTERDGQERIYLPVFWTSYYVNHDYGNDQRKKKALQDFIDSLDKSKKYFTIVQYDDGILNDISGLDIKVFGMGGGRIDYPLPLLCMPHPYQYDYPREIFANFVGSLTHQIRRDLKHSLPQTYYVPNNRLSTREFCQVLAKSIFTLCPRGYGETSFRILEALQYGSIPVYISDKHIIPHNVDFNSYGVLIGKNDVMNVDKILRAISPEEIQSKQEKGKEIFRNYYTYESNKNLILQNVG